MKKLTRLVCQPVLVFLLLSFSPVEAQLIQEITIDPIPGVVVIDGTAHLPAGHDIMVPIRIINQGTPSCKFAVSMAFTVESPDGAEWGGLEMIERVLFAKEVVPGVFIDQRISDIYSSTFYEEHSVNGQVADTIGFAGIAFSSDDAVFDGFDYVVWDLKIHLSASSVGKTICINNGGNAINGYEWAWQGLTDNSQVPGNCQLGSVVPDWNGPFCFEVTDQEPTCCGLYTGGKTGNIDCDPFGLRDIIDITRLIDQVYKSRSSPCCEENGNTSGDLDGKVNLADIIVLIDFVFRASREPVACQ